MKIKFNGAAKTVTGSQTLLQNASYSILVDCGLYQGPKPVRLRNWQKPDHILEVKALVLTHAHIDHSGLIPRWVKLGWRGPIYCTVATADLLSILLMDAAKLQEEDARFANKTKYSHHDPALALYDEADARTALDLIQPIGDEGWQDLSANFRVRFLKSGHILGSSIVQIQFQSGIGKHDQVKTITFSGDLSGGNSQILKQPVHQLQTDYLVIESTYGDRSIPVQTREQSLGNIVSQVFNRGGTLIIPAFALGRTQDILYSLWKLKNEKKIPDVPIYLDSPMANAVTQVYLKHGSELMLKGNEEIISSLSPPFFHPVWSSDDSMLLCMSSQPKIVISASGMLQGGRVLRHLRTRLSDSKSGVLFVGFQGQGTKGRLLQEGLKSLRIYHEEIDVLAEIFTIEGFSAHADQTNLLNWVLDIESKIEKVFINHGEDSAGRDLKKLLESKIKTEVIQPDFGDEFLI